MSRRSTARRRSPASRVFVAAVVVVLVVLGAAIVAEAATSMGRVHPGVSVAGVDVGGLSPAAARLRIERQLNARMTASPVVFRAAKETWKATADSVGASVDSSALVGSAMAVGRSGSLLRPVADRFRAWISPIDLPARASVSATKAAGFLAAVDRGVAVEPKDAVIRIRGVKFALVPSKKGQGLDRSAAEKMLSAGFLASKRTFEVPTSVVEPAIDDAEANGAMDVAKAYVAAPATVMRGSKTWSFAPAKIASWISFRPVGKTGSERLEAYIDPEELARTTKSAFGKLGRAPQDARFKVDNGRVTIVPSRDGVGPDMHALASDLSSALAQADGPRSVELKIGRAEPSLTTDEAKGYGIKERIATYTTTYGSSNRPRVNNIHLLASALNGKLIPPGGQFSFNGAVGQRTAEKGYQEAPAIVAGKLVPQLGGGICQVCTTMFNTVFFSGLPVDQRINHMFYISHYPAGRDATVSWGGPDFKFTNDTGHWVLIATSYTDSSITVSLYGTDPRYDVTYENGPWTNIRPFKVEEIKDPTLPLGSKYIEDSGVDGRSIVVTRTVKKDGKIIRVDRFFSDYKPKVATVKVGTKPAASKPTTATPKP